MHDRKIWDQMAGVENAGLENAGSCRTWKMKEHNVSENVAVKMSRHQTHY